jgi:hypothetical protein
VADAVLAPAAQETDQAPCVPVSHLEALADAGLFGLLGPVEHGGSDAPAAAVREVQETLAGACGVTFFVWVQHHSPVQALRATANEELRDRLLARLCSGEVMGGVAFGHLRRPGPPVLTARPVAGGWLFEGEAPWVTSWGLAGMYSVSARTAEGDGDDVVTAVVIGTEGDRLRASPPLRLAAMNASSTVRLLFDGLRVPDADVLSVVPFVEWQESDRVATAQPRPAPFGVAATCTRLLAELDADTAGRLEDDWRRCRDESYRLADEHRTDREAIDRLVVLRAEALELALRSAYALVAATGGRAMALDHPGQRLVREATFYAIQAQTVALRRATLDRLLALIARGPSWPPGPRRRPPT